MAWSDKYKKSIDEQLFAGFDVGKKRHPSHLVIFRRIGDKLEQIHQSWLDGWSYSDQIQYLNDVAENFPIDNAIHSFFGVSKTYADLIVQEYGKNVGLKTVCFRGGCITGPNHSGASLHGFLSFLVAVSNTGPIPI